MFYLVGILSGIAITLIVDSIYKRSKGAVGRDRPKSRIMPIRKPKHATGAEMIKPRTDFDRRVEEADKKGEDIYL